MTTGFCFQSKTKYTTLSCPLSLSSEWLNPKKPRDPWSLEKKRGGSWQSQCRWIAWRYSGSLLFVVLSHSMLSSLCVGEGRAPVAPPGRILSPWKRRHSGQMRMWLQPLATSAASWASLWDSGSGSPVPAHSLPLLRLTAAARARRSSKGKGRGRIIDAARRRLTCRLSRHMTIPWSSRSISSQTDCCKHTHREKDRGEGDKRGRERKRGHTTDWLTGSSHTDGRQTHHGYLCAQQKDNQRNR